MHGDARQPYGFGLIAAVVSTIGEVGIAGGTV
jgi:hypothetical protein